MSGRPTGRSGQNLWISEQHVVRIIAGRYASVEGEIDDICACFPHSRGWCTCHVGRVMHFVMVPHLRLSISPVRLAICASHSPGGRATCAHVDQVDTMMAT